MNTLLKEADYYKKLIADNKPTHFEKMAKWEKDIRNVFIYNSEAVEGSTLTITDIEQLMEKDIAVEGKSDRASEEAVGHGMAYDYMLSVAGAEQPEITEEMIKRLHELLYRSIAAVEAGQYRMGHAELSGIEHLQSDAEHIQPGAEDIPHLMEHFINQMRSSRRMLHPIEYAAISYKRLMDISPFKEGNGKVARLLINTVLVNSGYCVTTIPLKRHEEFAKALAESKKDNNTHIDGLINLLAECVLDAMKKYIKVLGIQEK